MSTVPFRRLTETPATQPSCTPLWGQINHLAGVFWTNSALRPGGTSSGNTHFGFRTRRRRLLHDDRKLGGLAGSDVGNGAWGLVTFAGKTGDACRNLPGWPRL